MRLANNLLDLHYKIFGNVKDKMAPFIEHLLKAPHEKKTHWWFCSFLDTQYAADLKEIRELHGFEGGISNTIIFEMKDHFLDYVTACENVHNPIVAPISSTVKDAYIYSEDEVSSTAVMLERKNNMYYN